MERFTHIYCDRCKEITPADRKKYGIYCEICDKQLLQLQMGGNGFCDLTDQFEELEYEPLEDEHTSGKFVGGDIICVPHGNILVTVYKPKLARVTEAASR